MEVRTATCHCGAVELRVELENGLDKAARCNCSLCRRKGAVMIGVPVERVTVIKGAERLTLYQWNTHVAKHYFCSVCGIYTHHQRRSNPSHFGVNVGCLDGVDQGDLAEVPTLDGASLSLAN
jgi:hypothetical protein